MTERIREATAKGRRARTAGWVVALMSATALVLMLGPAQAAGPTQADIKDYSQCANGKPNAGNDKTTCNEGWINGILNAQNSQYSEGNVTAQRLVLQVSKGTSATNRTFKITYLARKGPSHHAYDSLGRWDYTISGVNQRCIGLNPASLCIAGSSFPVPIPADNTAVPPATNGGPISSNHDLPDADRKFDIFGLGGTGAAAIASAPVHDNADGTNSGGDDFATVTVTYSFADSLKDASGNLLDNQVINVMFGGHLAQGPGGLGWGAGLGSSDISGGPYHIRVTEVDGASIGNRDNQIMSNAIQPITATLTTVLHETNSAGADVDPANNGATITVNLPANGTGVYVKDVASVDNAAATGTVSFTYYPTLADCQANTLGVSAGSGIALVPAGTSSSVVNFTSTGTFYWKASLLGTGNTENADSACGDEVLTVRQNTSTATVLHEVTNVTGDTDVNPANNANASGDLTVDIGDFVADVASLTPVGSTGSVTFVYYPATTGKTALANCTDDTNGVTVSSGVTVTSGSARSAGVQFNTPGTFEWRAFFTGTGAFNNSSSACGAETLTVNKATPGLTSTPFMNPQDTATLSNIVGGGTSSTLVFELYAPSNATCTGTTGLVYSETINNPGNGAHTTNNTGATSGTSSFRLTSASATGIYRWKITYSGNDLNNLRSSACGDEQFNFGGITDDTTS